MHEQVDRLSRQSFLVELHAGPLQCQREQSSCLTLLHHSSPGGTCTSWTIVSMSAGLSVIVTMLVCVCTVYIAYFGCEVRGFGECAWIHLATKRLHCRTWSECGCDVCWVAHDNSEVVLQVFSLVRVELGGRTTSHSMPNGVLCRDSKG